MASLPQYPSPEQRLDTGPAADVPQTISVATVLLVVNLVLSVLVTVLSLTHIDDLVRLAQEHQRSTSAAPVTRQTVRDGLYVRAGLNVAIGIVYFFLVRRLRRRNWRAWARMILISGAGSIGVVFLLTQPYTTIFKVEQVIQLAVLASIGACMLHPATRAFIGPRRRRSSGRRGRRRAA